MDITTFATLQLNKAMLLQDSGWEREFAFHFPSLKTGTLIRSLFKIIHSFKENVLRFWCHSRVWP